MSINLKKAANTNFKGYTRTQVAEIIKVYVLNCIPSNEEILNYWGKTTTSEKEGVIIPE